MDKKKQKMAPAQRPERQGQKEKTEDRKNMRKTKGAEPDTSSKSTSSERQQQSRQEELAVMKSDQSDGNVRMKIGIAAKRTKKPPKSLENFICRPTVRISQRLAHGDGQSSCGVEGSGSEITAVNQSNQEVQRKDSNDCISPKPSSTPCPTSSKKADFTCFTAPSKKAPSKQTKKTDSKSLLTDGPSYAVQPQTDSKVPLSDRIASTPLKQTYSPPAAPSPPSSLQQNSSPHDSTQVFNVQKLKGEDLPTEATITASLSSHSSKDTTLKSQQSSSSVENDSQHSLFPTSCAENTLAIKQMPCAPKKTKTSKIRHRNPEKCLNVNAKKDSKQNGDSKNMLKTVTNERSKKNDSGHQGISVLPAYKSADSSVPESSTEVLESKVRNIRQNEGEDIDDSRKRTIEPAQTIPVVVQPTDGSRVGHTIDRNKKRARHSSDHIENVQCSSQTTSCPDPQYNTSIHSTDRTSDKETHLPPKQIGNSQKKQKVQMVKMANQMEKMDLVETANISSNACKTVPETSKLKKISSNKSSKASPQYKPRPVGRPPKHKKLQNLSPRSEVTSHETQPKKRGRPKIIRLNKTPQGNKSHKTCTKSAILEHTNAPNPEVDLRLQMPVQRKRGRPKLSSSIQPHKSFDSGSVRKGAEENLRPSLSKTKDIQICRKRNRLIMKTIIKNINKMRMKKKDEGLTQFLSRQQQCYKADFAQNGNKEDADCSVSDPTQSLSSLVTSFGGKLGPQINVSKRGTIYIGKRRGRKPKTQKEDFGQDSEQIVVQKSQQMAESLSHLHSWSSPGEYSQSALCSSPHSFKYPESPSSTAGCFKRKLYTGNCEYNQHSAQKAKAVAEEGLKPHSTLQSTTLPLATTQLGSDCRTDCRTVHLDRSVLMEQERPKYRCHRKGQNCFIRDKIRKHKHKCKRKYLQLRAKRQDPEFLAEVEDLVVRLSAIRIVHHIPQGACGDEAKSGRKSFKGKKHPHVHQCLPQNLHHPTMFQINFSGYYSPQSDFPRDSLHYVGMADLKKNNRCPSQPTEHIVTHCPVVHKLAFPLTGGGCYHPSCKMPLSGTSFGFGLYRGYPPSATIYPSSPFLPAYVHPYSKNRILSPSKFHKRKHKFLRRDSPLCGGNPHGTYSNVSSQSSSDWFSRNNWQRINNKDKRLVDDGLRGREGIGGLLEQSKLRKDHASRRSSHSPFSSSVPTKKADKHKTSHLSFIGPAQLRPISKVRWAEHQQSWRWRGRVESEKSSNTLNQEVESDYHEDDTLVGPESDEDLQSTFLSDRTTCHHSSLKNPYLASSAKRQMTVQRSTAEVQCASSNLMRPGSSLMKGHCSAGDKRVSEDFQPGGPLFSEQYQHLTEGQDRGGRDPRHNITRTLIQTNKISPFSSTAYKTSFSHSSSSTTTALSRRKLKHVIKPLTSPKSPQSQTVTGSEVKKRGPGRPRKNPAPCFSSSLTAALLYRGATESPLKHRKVDNAALNATESVSQYEKRKERKKRDIEKVRDGGQMDGRQDTAVGQEPLRSHTGSSSPFQDASVSEYSQSETSSALPLDKKYERAGLYSDVYKTEAPMSLSSPENTECLEYDPEEHDYGLLPTPIHVGKYLRLKRIDFQLPYDIYWLCAHKKLDKMSDTPLKTTISNGCVGVMSLTQPKDSSYKHHKDSVPHDCISDSLNRDDSLRPPAEKVGEEISETELDNKLPNQSDPLKQQERGSDAENISSPLLIMPLSCEERSFILEHSIFLVRNYEKMRERQAMLLKEGVREREKEDKEYGGSGQCQKGVLEDTSTKSDKPLTHLSLQPEDRLDEENRESVQSRNLTQTLQELYDVIVSYKGSSGQTLAAPLLNLCSRKRSGSAPVDLSMLQKQLRSGRYESLDVFHSDMLRVFQCAEKYYGCESSVGHNVRQLREVYHSAHQEALTQIGNFL